MPRRPDSNNMKTTTGLDQWFVSFDIPEGENGTATIFRPIPGASSGMRVQIAEIDEIECGPDEFGDWDRIRKGDEADRLRNVALIVNAPEMLDGIQQTIKELKEILEGPAGKDMDEKIYMKLLYMQDRLERTADEATDLDLV